MNEEVLISGYQSPPLNAPVSSVPAPTPAPLPAGATVVPMPLPQPVSLPVSAQAPLSTAEAALYFFLGLALNIIGLVVSLFTKRGTVPAMIGFAFSFALYDSFVVIRLGVPIGFSALTFIFLIIAYYRYSEQRNPKEGNRADFVFYLVLGLVFNFVGLFFGMFQNRRKGHFGAGLGFLISTELISLSLLIIFAVGRAAGFAVFFALEFCVLTALVVVVFFKIRRGWDGNVMSFLTFLLLSAAFGPFGILPAILNPCADAVFGGIMGIFLWVDFIGAILIIQPVFYLSAVVGCCMMIGAIAMIGLLRWKMVSAAKEPPEPQMQVVGSWMQGSHML